MRLQRWMKLRCRNGKLAIPYILLRDPFIYGNSVEWYEDNCAWIFAYVLRLKINTHKGRSNSEIDAFVTNYTAFFFLIFIRTILNYMRVGFITNRLQDIYST